jgi:hypothetical protein
MSSYVLDKGKAIFGPKHHVLTAYGVMEVKLHTLISVLDADDILWPLIYVPVFVCLLPNGKFRFPFSALQFLTLSLSLSI